MDTFHAMLLLFPLTFQSSLIIFWTICLFKFGSTQHTILTYSKASYQGNFLHLSRALERKIHIYTNDHFHSLDEKFHFDKHVNLIFNSAANQLKGLKRLRRFLEIEKENYIFRVSYFQILTIIWVWVGGWGGNSSPSRPPVGFPLITQKR